jgi:hypothetical protein
MKIHPIVPLALLRAVENRMAFGVFFELIGVGQKSVLRRSAVLQQSQYVVDKYSRHAHQYYCRFELELWSC